MPKLTSKVITSPTEDHYQIQNNGDIVDITTGEIILKEEELSLEGHQILDQIDTKTFLELTSMKPQQSVQDLGPAFIDKQGNFYYAKDIEGYPSCVHHNAMCDIVFKILLKRFQGIADDEVIHARLMHISRRVGWQHDLDTFCKNVGLLRFNTGSTADDHRFYTVLFEPLSGRQRYSWEEFLEWGLEHGKRNVMVFIALTQDTEDYKTFSFVDYAIDEIVKCINKAYTFGGFTENLHRNRIKKIIKENNSLHQGDNNVYYHATPYRLKGNKLYPNEQGLHLACSIEDAQAVMQDRNTNTYDIYAVTIPYKINALRVDTDLAYWSASEIASLLLLKLGEDIQPETVFNNEYVTPDMIHIDNLEKEDIPFLEDIVEMSENDYQDLFKIMDFLKSKGYNAISYPLIESDNNSDCIMIATSVPARLIGGGNAKDDWEYSDEMMTSYNDYYRGV